jgi:hypothetical protein
LATDVNLPPSKTALQRASAIGRYMSCRISSSRDHSTCTGRAATCIAQATASRTRSTSARLPNPPPRKVVCTTTSDCDRPAARAPARRIRVGDWFGIQSSSDSPRNSAVQFIGSIGVCARYGAR